MNITKWLYLPILVLTAGLAWSWQTQQKQRDQILELQVRGKEQSAIISHLHEELLKQQNRLNVEAQRVQAAEDDQRSRISALNGLIQVKTQNLSELQGHYQSLQNTGGSQDVRSRLQQKLRDQYAQLQKLETDMRTLRTSPASKGSVVESREIEDVETQLAQQNQDLARLEAELRQLKIAQGSSLKQVQSLEATLRTQTNKRNSLLNAINGVSLRYSNETRAAGGQNAAAKAAAANDANVLSQLSREQSELNQSLQEQQENLDRQKAELDRIGPSTENQIHQVQQQISAAIEAKKSLQVQKAQLQKKKQMLQNEDQVQRSHQVAQLQSLEIQYNLKVSAYRQTQEQLQALEVSQTSHSQTLKVMQENLQKEEGELVKLRQELATAQAELLRLEK